LKRKRLGRGLRPIGRKGIGPEHLAGEKKNAAFQGRAGRRKSGSNPARRARESKDQGNSGFAKKRALGLHSALLAAIKVRKRDGDFFLRG